MNARRLFLGGFVALLCAQLLYGALMLSAIYKQYQEPVFQVNGLLCRNIAEHLSFLIRVGKNLRPQTVARALAPYHDRADAENIAVTDSAGNVIFQWDADGQPTVTVPADAKTLFGPLKKFSTDDAFWTSCAILDRQDTPTGYVFMALDKTRITNMVHETVKGLLRLFVGIAVGEVLLLAILLRAFTAWKKRRPPDEDERRDGLKLRACFMLPLVLGQILFLLLLQEPLSSFYQNEQVKTGRQLAVQMSWDFERLAGMGMPVDTVRSISGWLTRSIRDIDALGIAVYDDSGVLHCAVSHEKTLSASEWEQTAAQGRLVEHVMRHPTDGSPIGKVHVVTDSDAMRKNLRSILLDNLTMTVIAALFLSELLYLLLMGGGRLQDALPTPAFMRPVIFACLFGTELSMSYVPIRIGELGLDLFGLAPEVVAGLPISCELFMAALAMFLGGFWSQRSGWRPMLESGLALAFAGSCLSWLSTDPLYFILSRGLSGLGYGFMNLAAQVFVISRSGEKDRAGNLAFMFAGLYAGVLCGSALGGLIADRLGYAAVFPASAVILLLLTVTMSLRLPRECWIPDSAATSRLSLKEALAFLTDRRMGAHLLFFVIPNALITVCLFQYFIPLFLDRSGVSAASIGRVFLLYCIIVMFAGPLFGKMLDRAKRMEYPLFLAMLLTTGCSIALLCFEGLTAAMLCVGLLGVNTSVAANGQGPYALSLPAASRLGHGRTIGFYNVAMRLGQVLGPLCLGIMIAVWDVRTGLTALAVLTTVCAGLFALFSFPSRKER